MVKRYKFETFPHIRETQRRLPVAGLAAPLFGPVSAVTITLSVIPVVRRMHISTSGSPSVTLVFGTSTLTSGAVEEKWHSY